MRAITLWQPWASAVALGSKTIETRHWSTNYRGPLAIHAAKRRNIGELDDLWRDARWRGALFPLICVEGEGGRASRFQYSLPFGAIVAVATSPLSTRAFLTYFELQPRFDFYHLSHCWARSISTPMLNRSRATIRGSNRRTSIG